MSAAAFEHVAANAVEAVRERLAALGLEDFEVVVNVAWRAPGGGEFALGSAVPDRLPMLADSLHQSAEEANPDLKGGSSVEE